MNIKRVILAVLVVLMSGCAGLVDVDVVGRRRIPLVRGEWRLGPARGITVQVFNMDTTPMVCGVVDWRIAESGPVVPSGRCVFTVTQSARGYVGRTVSFALRFIDAEGNLLEVVSEDVRVGGYNSRGVTCTASRAKGLRCDSHL